MVNLHSSLLQFIKKDLNSIPNPSPVLQTNILCFKHLRMCMYKHTHPCLERTYSDLRVPALKSFSFSEPSCRPTDWLADRTFFAVPWRLTGFLWFSSITGIRNPQVLSHSCHPSSMTAFACYGEGKEERESLHLPGSVQRVMCDIATQSSIKISYSTALNLLPTSCNKRHFTFPVISLL